PAAAVRGDVAADRLQVHARARIVICAFEFHVAADVFDVDLRRSAGQDQIAADRLDGERLAVDAAADFHVRTDHFDLERRAVRHAEHEFAVVIGTVFAEPAVAVVARFDLQLQMTRVARHDQLGAAAETAAELDALAFAGIHGDAAAYVVHFDH